MANNGTQVLKLGLDPKIQVAVTIGNTGFPKLVLNLILPDLTATFVLYYFWCLWFPSKKKSVGARCEDYKLPQIPPANCVCSVCVRERKK